MKKNIHIFLFLILTIRISAQNHYVVTTANDPVNPFNTVSGELRWAIEQANAHIGADYIDFNIPGVIPPIIQLQSLLPSIIDPITINGFTQPTGTYQGLEPKVWINGSLVSSSWIWRNGASNSLLQGVLMYNFSGGILALDDASNCEFIDNVFHSSTGIVFLGNCDNNVFYGNILGTDHTFTTDVSVFGGTIRLIPGFNGLPDGNIFGGLQPGQKNYFYNSTPGGDPIDIQSGINNKVSGNIFVNNVKNIDIYGNSGCLGNLCKARPNFLVSNTGQIRGTSLANDFIEVYLSNAGGIDAVQFLGTATTDASGQWSMGATGFNAGDKVVATATDPQGNTSEFSLAATIQGPCCTITNVSQISQLISGNACPISYAAIATNQQTGQMVGTINATTSTCIGRDISFNFSSLSCNSGTQFSVNYGDGYIVNNVTTSSHAYTTAGTYTAVITTSSNPSGACSQTINYIITVETDCCPTAESFLITATSDPSLGDTKILCAGSPVNFHLSSFGNCVADEAAQSAQWNFSNGTAANGQNVQQNFIAPGTYTVSCLINVPNCAPVTVTQTFVVEDCGDIIPCTSCIGSFAPEPGEYIASVWVRELLPVNPNLFASAEMRISFIGAQGGVSIVASSDNKIIDGWQRMEAKINVPAGATQLTIKLLNNSTNTNNKVYFDDVRIHPFDASMKTYVYDPITLRLVAELDERNYATFYEYDEEGILIRVKKETEKGIMTIKETRQNNSKTGQ